MATKETCELFSIDSACAEAIDSVLAYASEDCLSKRDYQTVVRGLKKKDVSHFTDSDWFLLFDALGTRDQLSKGASELYALASYVWYMAQHFRGLTK